MELSIKEIQEIIPHRYPFLLIDKIIEMEPGIRAVGIKNVTMNEYFFQGHFPSEPVMPGVLIIEALAQTGAVAVLSMEQFRNKTAYFAGIKSAKMKRKVVPGDTLKLETSLVKLKCNFGIANCIATVNGEKAVEAELMFAIK